MVQPPHAQVSIAELTSELKGLRDKIVAGFEEIGRRFDDHKEDTHENSKSIKDLDQRIRAMELAASRAEGSNYDKRMGTMAKRVSDLEKWRWKLAGVIAAMGAGFGVLLKWL